jgi:NADH-quinone oxidoreductase subunit N
VYEGSPNVTTVFFAVVPKIALFVLLTRICYISFYSIFVNNFQAYFLLLAVLSVFTGSFGGLEQRKVKTLLAYSSISHTGYLFLSFSTGNFEGLQMLFYYLVIYMISSLCFWAVYLFLRQKRTSYVHKSNKELGDFVLLNESNFPLAIILAITLFSIAGIPPLVGFLAKIGVFLVVVKSSAYLVAVISILFSVISTFYYIRFIKILYFENTMVGNLYFPISTSKAVVIAILSLLLVILCLNPTLIYLLFYKAILLGF